MLRDLLDIAWLEDFVSGLARCTGLRALVFDARGGLIVASAPSSAFTKLSGLVLNTLPPRLELVTVPAHDPPAQIAYVPDRGVWYIVAPVHVDEQDAGYVAIGEFREHSPSGEDWRFVAETAKADLPAVIQAWDTLPPLDRSGASIPVVAVRWGARLLADAGRREARLISATQEVALVGDIAALLNGEEDLQHVLDRIVSDVAKVMQCPYASMRLYNAESKELSIKAIYGLSPAYVAKGAVLRLAGSIDDMALGGQVVQIDDMTSDPRVQYPDEARREGIVSMLTAGMIYRGNPVGVLRIYTRRRRRFRKGQRDLLRAVAYQAATAIVHAQIVDERIKAAETQRQLELAGDLQRRMIRSDPPRRPNVETAVVFQPSYQVSGDFCDVLVLRDGRLAAVVGDVVGKGIPASLLMSTVRGAIRAAAEWCSAPGELLTHLNRQVCRETLPREFVTLALVALDTHTLELTYCSAGHEPLMILRGETIEQPEEGDTVLGINPDVVYNEYPLALRGGDLVLLYTDGAIEARGFDGEQFGRERLRESLITYAPLSTQQVLNSILWDVRRYVGLAEQMDDLTLVALRVK